MENVKYSVLLLISLTTVATVVSSDDEYSRADFPVDFIFGAGTSAYQVEGAANEDGRTPSIWDTFAHSEKSSGATGDIASDQYHKYMEDVKLMVDTGLEAYRFSISWSRLISNGRGPVNSKGLQYYNNLINALISHGIQPHVTLVHYDLPQALEDEYGGWIDRKIVEDFTAYADVCFREFGDRILHWTTVNEPNIFAIGGYGSGLVPPNHCSPPFGVFNCSRGNSSTEPYLALHNMLLSHSSASQLYREKYQTVQHGVIGISIYAQDYVPYTNSKEDIAAAQRVNEFYFGWIAHPLTYGDYPDIMKKNVGSRLPRFTESESKLVKGSADFLGLIHYFMNYIKDKSESLNVEERDFMGDAAAEITYYRDNSTRTFEYPIAPDGLQDILHYVKQAYGNPPVYILENGQMTRCNSTLNDLSRVEYLHAYTRAVLNAIRNGSNVRGYFVWSFLDLLELLDGYGSSYGLYYVDLDDPNRTRYPKLSAHWYSNFLKGGHPASIGAIEIEKNKVATSL